MDKDKKHQCDIDFEIALKTGNILAAKYIIKQTSYLKLNVDMIQRSFELTLTHGHHEMASWLDTLKEGDLLLIDYGNMLFKPISDETVQWIFNHNNMFTELFRVLYLDARENGNNSLLDKLSNFASKNGNTEVYIIN